MIKGHGKTEMPTSGDLFNSEAMDLQSIHDVRAAEIFRSRILGLVYYLKSVQE